MRKKSMASEPTMTMHTKAATDEISFQADCGDTSETAIELTSIGGEVILEVILLKA